MTGSGAAPIDDIVRLLADLVRTPSRAADDDPSAITRCIEQWFARHGLPFKRLQQPDGRPLGLYAEARGRLLGGPWIVLDATLDTAGFGDLANWHHPPCSGRVADGWLYGRGAADSKAAVAVFAHLLREWASGDRLDIAGRLGVLFDLDEHSGGFGGARAFFDRPLGDEPTPRPDGVIIGYPGDHEVVTGGRGFLRARLQVAGVSAHSGASEGCGVNAIERATSLACALKAMPLPDVDRWLGLPPRLTITGIEGGDAGFSQVPDRCELRLDLRLTSTFDDAAARRSVEQIVRLHDVAWPQVAPTGIQWLPGWPAYRVGDEHPMVRALRDAAWAETGRRLPTRVVGPSNIGNYLAGLGVPALCGFGVRGEGIHASNERIAIDSIDPVYRIYRAALRQLFSA